MQKKTKDTASSSTEKSLLRRRDKYPRGFVKADGNLVAKSEDVVRGC